MADQPTKMTDAAFAKLVAQLCEDHGRIWVAREPADDGVALIITSRTSEPVRCLLASRKRA